MLNSSRFNLVPASGDLTIAQSSVGMELGDLTGVQAFTTGDTVSSISIWVELALGRSVNPIDRIMLLASGYVTNTSTVGWSGLAPLGPDTFLTCRAYAIGTAQEIQIGYSVNRPQMNNAYPFPMPWPETQRQVLTNPGAGNNFSGLIIGNQRKHLLTLEFVLTTDANAANRTIEVGSIISANSRFGSHSSADQTANTSFQYFFDIGVGSPYQIGSGNAYMIPLNTWIILEPSESLTISVNNIQVGDTITAIIATYGVWARPGAL